MRWSRIALSTLVLSTLFILDLLGGGAGGANAATAAAAPPLTLVSQTQWVTPTAPWYSLDLAVAPGVGSASALHVDVTIYGRVSDPSEFQQATDSGTTSTPDLSPLAKVDDIAVTAGAGGQLGANTCVTVLPDQDTTPPPSGATGSCPANGPTVTLDCTPGGGLCDDVYPVSVALFRSGTSSSSTPVSRFTTFMTYEEPTVATSGTGGPLRVSWIVPVANRVNGSSGAAAASRNTTEALIAELAAHHTVSTTLSVSPATAADLSDNGGKTGAHALDQLSGLASAGSQLLAPSFAAINVSAMAGAGLATEIPLQMARGTQLLHQAALAPTAGSWVDTNPSLSSADLTNLSAGLSAVGADQVVVSDAALASVNDPSGFTLAQPFSLGLAHGGHIAAVTSSAQVDSRFTAQPGDPTLAANQLLAGLSFIHFENEFKPDPRGVVITPPAGWHASPAFVGTLLSGLANTQIVSPVTLNQLFTIVPVGGNGAPATRHLQTGPGVGTGTITPTSAARILADRSALNSFTAAVSGHAPELSTLGDQLLASESDTLTAPGRSAAISAFDIAFTQTLSQISLAVERTITFTSRTASIPITVLSSAPYEVKVVLTLQSDKFTFPNGSTRTLTLDHSSTSVRVEARARTSGDRLPVDITLRTPDGGLTISHATLAVHSTSISLVGIALTVIAGLVLLVWWIRTWRKGRHHRPRAH